MKTDEADNKAEASTDDELLTIGEVAKWYRCSKKFIYALVERREIPFYKISNQLRFSRLELTTWLRKHWVAILEGDRAIVCDRAHDASRSSR